MSDTNDRGGALYTKLQGDPGELGNALLKVLNLDNQQVTELRLVIPADGLVRVEATFYFQVNDDAPAAEAIRKWLEVNKHDPEITEVIREYVERNKAELRSSEKAW